MANNIPVEVHFTRDNSRIYLANDGTGWRVVKAFVGTLISNDSCITKDCVVFRLNECTYAYKECHEQACEVWVVGKTLEARTVVQPL